MKGITIVALFVVIAVVWAHPVEDKYSDQFDNIDIDEILNSNRLLNNYYNCLKTGKKCTPDGQRLKDVLPDALQTKCKRCTDVQFRQSRKVLRFLIKNEYDKFHDLETLYDPEYRYRVDYADELKAEGIVLPPV